MLEGFILRPLRIPHGLDQCPPLVIRRHRDSYPAILSPARVYAMRSGCRMAVPCALHSPPVRLKLQQGRGHELQPRLVLSQIYVGTLTGSARMVQSREYGNQTESHTNEVYIWAIEETGICIRIAGEMREPRQRSELRTESRVLGMGSGLSLIAATKHDQRWIHFCQFLISQTQATHSPRREVLYHHVGPSHGLLRSVSYTHLRAHETKANLVCRLLLEKNKKNKKKCDKSHRQMREERHTRLA